MKPIFTILCAIFFTQTSFGQKNELSIFNNLIGKKWEAEGNWGDGSKFKQEITFSYDLNNTIVIVQSNGYTNQEQTQYGARNHGIRKFDTKTNTLKFWEFDVFGGLTEGEIKIDGKNIIYQYQYGKSVVTDMWEYVDDNTYNFKVGNYNNGIWKQVYLSTQFKTTTK